MSRPNAPSPQAMRQMQAAVAAQRQGDVATAGTIMRELVRRYPRFADARHFLGLLLFQTGEKEAALKRLGEAQRLAPDNVGFLLNHARVLRETGASRSAAACLERAHRLAPDHAPALLALAELLVESSQGGKVLDDIERETAARPKDWRMWMLLGQCREQAGDTEGALGALEAACRRAPAGVARPHLALGETAQRSARYGSARKAFEAALAAEPHAPGAPFALGRLAAEYGDIARAESLLRRALAANRDFYPAWEWLSLIGANAPESLVNELEATARRAGENPAAWLLQFSVAREREKLGRYEEAFAAYAKGNRMQAAGNPYSRAWHRDYTRNLIENLGAAFLARDLRRDAAARPVPIFVCGMPRSGTTLVETILAAHPRIAAGGEMRYIHDKLRRALTAESQVRTGEWLARSDAATLEAIATEWAHTLDLKSSGRDFVTDKMPDNYALLGLINLCLPAARIVHVRRDPRDTCFSCFATPFMQGHRFSNNLGDAGYHYRLHERLMHHWRARLGAERIIEVRYEALVSEPEGVIRHLLAALGLEWDRRCLAFHERTREVHTASLTQVRQPIYTRSVGRWRHFEEQLGPLLEALETPLPID